MSGPFALALWGLSILFVVGLTEFCAWLANQDIKNVAAQRAGWPEED